MPVVFAVVRNMSGMVSTASKMPMPSTGRPAALRTGTIAKMLPPGIPGTANVVKQASRFDDTFQGRFQFLKDQLPVAGQAKQFCGYMQRNVTATFDLGDKLIQAKDMQDAVKIQSEFFQDQMRSLTDLAKSMGGLP